MRYEVTGVSDGASKTSAPGSLEDAKATITRLAGEIIGREPFCAYVVPVPDDAEPPDAPTA